MRCGWRWVGTILYCGAEGIAPQPAVQAGLDDLRPWRKSFLKSAVILSEAQRNRRISSVALETRRLN